MTFHNEFEGAQLSIEQINSALQYLFVAFLVNNDDILIMVCKILIHFSTIILNEGVCEDDLTAYVHLLEKVEAHRSLELQHWVIQAILSLLKMEELKIIHSRDFFYPFIIHVALPFTILIS